MPHMSLWGRRLKVQQKRRGRSRGTHAVLIAERWRCCRGQEAAVWKKGFGKKEKASSVCVKQWKNWPLRQMSKWVADEQNLPLRPCGSSPSCFLSFSSASIAFTFYFIRSSSPSVTAHLLHCFSLQTDQGSSFFIEDLNAILVITQFIFFRITKTL